MPEGESRRDGSRRRWGVEKIERDAAGWFAGGKLVYDRIGTFGVSF